MLGQDMGVTKVDNINAATGHAKIVANLDITPAAYYDADSNDIASVTWTGGELSYLTTENRMYIQTATSGTSPTWKRLLETFATTTSTTTSSSSTTTSSSSTSTSTSTTTTSTSTSSSSSTSTSTSTSSTTTSA